MADVNVKADEFSADDFIEWYKDKRGTEPRKELVTAAEYIYKVYNLGYNEGLNASGGKREV